MERSHWVADVRSSYCIDLAPAYNSEQEIHFYRCFEIVNNESFHTNRVLELIYNIFKKQNVD